MATIKQGDAYALPIHLSFLGNDINNITIDQFSVIEFYLGDEFREWRADGTGAVSFDGKHFLWELTQEETLNMASGKTMLMDVRIMTVAGDVKGIEGKLRVNIEDARSRRILR